MPTPVARHAVPCLLLLLLAACTGLSAGPEVSAVTPVPASAPEVTASEKPDLCEQDRQKTLDRILLVVVPPAK